MARRRAPSHPGQSHVEMRIITARNSRAADTDTVYPVYSLA